MNCPRCAAALDDGAKFCGKCGNSIDGAPLNGRFKLESKIGAGGFGAVYRGTELATGRKVAIKLLHPEMTKDQNLVARFRREGEVARGLHDPHTITTFDFDQAPDGTLYIAMELLEGRSLAAVFRESRTLAWQRMFGIVLEMCSSLGEAHAQGVVHRDLKPDNIYLESRPGNPDFVKVLDFGMAKVIRGDGADPNAPKLTAMGQTLGTLEYMSPEQLMGQQALDSRSDIYALGVLAYEMITGRLPFAEKTNPVALMMAQLKETVVPPSVANPNAQLPPEVDAVILRCLDKNKGNRFQSVGELAAAIQQLMPRAQPIAAPVAPPIAAPIAPIVQPMPEPVIAPTVPLPTATKSKLGMWLVLGAIAIGAVLTIVILAK